MTQVTSISDLVEIRSEEVTKRDAPSVGDLASHGVSPFVVASDSTFAQMVMVSRFD
jgi:hypothetical protein